MLEELTLYHQQKMEDICAGDVSQHLFTTALSSSPFLFPEGQRSSSHIRESHWVQDCSGEQYNITECHAGSGACSNGASHTQSSGRGPGTDGLLLSGE